MESSSVEAILRVLNERKVRYLIVGGLAVVAHGYLRFTADVDLVLAFDNGNLIAARDMKSSNENDPAAAPSNGWERHELEQLIRLSELSFPRKLAWLEQAQRTAEYLRRSAARSAEEKPPPA